MFQNFEDTARPADGPPRLAALRRELEREGLAGYLVPRADAHQGEYVAARDERLRWLTSFTGSAGFCAVLADRAGLFVDGRYRVQARAQVAEAFTPVDWPEVQLADWLREALPGGGEVGFDPWLHSLGEIAKLSARLEGSGIGLRPCENLVDRIWEDQPAPPAAPAAPYPEALAGESAAAKRSRLGAELAAAGQGAAFLSLPDSIAWLLNIRGGDIPRVPVAHGFALLNADASVDLVMAQDKLAGLEDHLGPEVRLHAPEALQKVLSGAAGPVRLDPASCPVAVRQILEAAAVEIAEGPDPCQMPKACKTPAELAGAREAHLRDGAAVCEFLCWLDAQPPGSLTEIAVVEALEGFRRATGALRDISFETIAGAGPNGAIVHYRVTRATDRRLDAGELLLLDSGGQYEDGTTDITRTMPIGPAEQIDPEARAAFTRVLRGMIAVSRLRFPKGLTGRDIDPLARAPLWAAGQDYAHGTGHGVGAFLSVHEGPQRISRQSDVALRPGMILSNEPGFYREGAFGIRIENLIVVEPAPALPGGTLPEMLRFETLTLVPIDRRLIDPEALERAERDWLNAYHADVRARIGPRLGSAAQTWLDAATAPI